ncbi:hypothetical protein QSV34_03085 [Porticoccus sp. W117]|uniref:hypothetical protein n=1 Tax=Porticoccus sp. W117 TaxID=3054777 RepID=UPI0025994102|nr:hypothetical protein [Porticoccus sp. W117]MDM3870333.1 hypothetical protein [Porticoccus sp. W117]
MEYIWVIVVLALVLSPIIGLKSSPRQKKLETLRRCASAAGLHVKIARRPDARDDERDLDSVSYLLPWGGNTPEGLRPWVLTHNNRRGMEAQWPNWRWFEGPAQPGIGSTLEQLLPGLPDGVTGLVVSRQGLAIHWLEQGEEADVAALVDALKTLRQALQK